MSFQRIMIVEDEPIVAFEIQEGLEELGYYVPFVAPSGEEALENIPEVDPDLVLMDIKLAGHMDGIETAQRIKEMLNIPVIFLTAYSDEQNIKRAITSDSFGYILKPFEEKKLHTAIEISLEKSKKERQLIRDKNFYESLLSSMDTGIIVIDIKTSIQYINKKGLSILNQDDEQGLIGQKLFKYLKIFTPEGNEPLNLPIMDIFLNKRNRIKQDCLLRVMEEESTTQICLLPFKRNQNIISGIVVTFDNI